MSHQLIVLPDDTAKPILDAINGARTALNIRMFLFTDETLLAAVVAAKQRGVKVRVMLNPARRSGETENEASRQTLVAAGIEVRDSNPKFDLTHQKSMVVDNRVGFVESLNWEPKDLTETRDYAVITTHALETGEMEACFDADWAHADFTPHPDSRLIWCPDNGRPRVAAFIDGAKHSLWVQNERYQDTVIIERLVRAATRGVKIHILTKPPHSLKAEKLIEGVGGLRILQDVGAKVHTMKHLKLHAKMMLADGQRAIVGSINLAPGSFDGRRELAIETDDPATVLRLRETAERDWASSHKIDLSDAGLLHDLQKRNLDPAHLVLDGSAEQDDTHKEEAKSKDEAGGKHSHKKH
ncbi:phospholipase D-like domain-containing protein [Variovorax sp. J31P179]|uniref:phospholipase D-like domain-containing protein n=1 Tax=Variovorax sp. J31P179 TaxID=3053508 RepID=UPI00257868A9|nr:phospholipase D-like domain-containing protein [Variovorax sp. J31P179]MDM0084938.1 phospholipase D-like domain-containing protein [Variovorax sp. J31P179]